MVKGLFTKLEFPYCQFPCTALSGDQMYHPLWEAVERLKLCGFKVLGLICDGLAANRRLFCLHEPTTNSTFVHKVSNPYTEDDRPFFFFSDPPHLMKTVRNCWVSQNRHLWVCIITCIISNSLIFVSVQNGKDISWSYLQVNLYYNNRSQTSAGLALVKKLKYEHVYLTSYSKCG